MDVCVTPERVAAAVDTATAAVLDDIGPEVTVDARLGSAVNDAAEELS